MSDIIPDIGDWVTCRGNDLGPGKVTSISLGKNEFSAEFLGEADTGIEDPSITEETLQLHEITGIITDKEHIKQLEDEMQGEFRHA